MESAGVAFNYIQSKKHSKRARKCKKCCCSEMRICDLDAIARVGLKCRECLSIDACDLVRL